DAVRREEVVRARRVATGAGADELPVHRDVDLARFDVDRAGERGRLVDRVDRNAAPEARAHRYEAVRGRGDVAAEVVPADVLLGRERDVAQGVEGEFVAGPEALADAEDGPADRHGRTGREVHGAAVAVHGSVRAARGG